MSLRKMMFLFDQQAEKPTKKTTRELIDTSGMELLKLIQQGDLKKINEFLKTSTDPLTDILHLYFGHQGTIISAINKQKNPEMQRLVFGVVCAEFRKQRIEVDDEGYTLTHWALALDLTDVVKRNTAFDIEAETQPTRKYATGERPIMIAIRHGAVESFEYLLNRNANFRASHGDSPFMFAVRFGHLEMVKLLIAGGVQLRLLTQSKIVVDESNADLYPHVNGVYYFIENKEKTALYEAARCGREEVVSYLINEYSNQDIHTKVISADTGKAEPTMELVESAISAAVFEGRVNIVRMLVDHFNVDVNAIKHLHLELTQDDGSEGHDHTGCLQFLLDRGLDPNSKASVQGSLLVQAISEGNVAAVRTLLARGATPKLNFSYSIMRRFSGHEDIEIAQEIFSRTKPTDKELTNAMYHAIQGANIELVDLLIQHGAQLKSSHLIGALSKEELFSALLMHYSQHFSNAAIKETAIAALTNFNIEAFEVLYSLLKPANPADFAPYLNLDTHIMGSAQHSKVREVLKFLLGNKLDPNIKLGNETLLSRAARGHNVEACEMLLDAGANPNLAQVEFPIISAVRRRNESLVRLLLKHNSEKHGALEMAQKLRCGEIMALLDDNAMEVDADNADGQHLYIHFGLTMFSIVGGGIFNHEFILMSKMPELLNKLPRGMQANCSFASLKDIDFSNPNNRRIPEGVIDMGMDNEDTGSGDELMQLDFYYDCEDLDREVAQRAIERLKDYYVDMNNPNPPDIFSNREKEPFNPVITPTKILLECIEPKNSPRL